MSSLIATAAVIDLLRQAKDMTEICDINGNVIGFFTPVSTDAAANSATPVKCHTTKQVFERLLSLTKDVKMQGYLQQKIQILAERDGCALP